MVRRCSSFGQHQVQVVLPSGDQLVVPEWMLDEELCRGMEIVARPTPALSALVALRSLLDPQPLISAHTGSVASEASSPGGASSEPTTPGVSFWGIPSHQELPQAAQARCRELLSHVLLAAASGTTGEERDER